MTLREALAAIDRIPAQEWHSSLPARSLAEMAFHDKARGILGSAGQDEFDKIYTHRKFYRAVERSAAYTQQWVDREAKGRVFLDYACGEGPLALRAAKAGAELAIGIDISDVSVENCRRKARDQGVTDNTFFVQSNAEATRLPDASIDRILCSGVLHHLDLNAAFPELFRILKPGGKLLAVESLAYNPAIQLYRKLTPNQRTDWEKNHILGLRELRLARTMFQVGEVRYWHVLAYAGGFAPSLMPVLTAIDRVLERIPLVQLMAWIWTFELIRPER
jgi:ubiquinone/menaquinone biosynthesis C-methylase UbiE